MTRFRFISAHRAAYGVKRLCRLLEVSRSGFYAWLAGEPRRAAQAAADAALTERIRAIHDEFGGTYGSPRVTAELRDRGEHVNRKRVARLMRTAGIVGLHLRRKRRTTIPDPAAVVALTCWSATSPPTVPTVSGPGTSPTCAWPTAGGTWPP